MAEDLYVPGNLLFSELRAMLTTNIDGTFNDNNTEVIVGKYRNQPKSLKLPYQEGVGTNATFGEISSFVQRNKTHVYIADGGFKCVRLLDRITNSTSLVAGTCSSMSSSKPVDGEMLEDQFSTLSGIAYYNDVVYVNQEYSPRSIRKIDFSSGNVTTIVTEQDFHDRRDQPSGIVVVPWLEVAYITVKYGIALLDLRTDSFSYVAENGHTSRDPKPSAGHKDGPLQDSLWYYVTSIALANNTLFVVDVYNYKLRSIDLKTQKVSTVWFNTTAGPTNRLEGTRSVVAVANCTLFISGKSRTNSFIKTLSLPEELCISRRSLEISSTGTSTEPNGYATELNYSSIDTPLSANSSTVSSQSNFFRTAETSPSKFTESSSTENTQMTTGKNMKDMTVKTIPKWWILCDCKGIHLLFIYNM